MGVCMDFGIDEIIYLIIVIRLIILFYFLRTLFRNNSYKASALHNVGKLQHI